MTERTVRTVCNLCGLCGCGMEVTVRDGVAVDVRGDRDHSENAGALCPKGRKALDMLYSPDRLTHPLKRVGARGAGQWERISWDEALETIAGRFQAIKESDGAEAVCFHKGSGHDLCGGDVRPYLHRLANLFGTPNLSSPFYICNGPRSLNMFLMTGGVPAPDALNSECVLLWGINPVQTALPRQIKLRRARERGAKLIVVDPRRTHSAKHADVHLQPQPGTDGALALGMLRVIVDENLFDAEFVANWTAGFDELKALLRDYPPERVAEITQVPAEAIREATRMYATHGPACIFLGNALDQQTNTSQAIRAITAMIAITGNLDVAGGNVMLGSAAMAKKSVAVHEWLPAEMAAKRLGSQFLLPRFEFTRLAHTPSVVKAILEQDPYPVKGMFIMAANPAMTAPNSRRMRAALRKLSFLAVADIFMTETAQMADIVLPACTFLEDTYYATYDAGAYLLPDQPGLLMLRPQVVAPLAESRSDWQIICDLARKLGYGEMFPWETIEEAIDHELEMTGITARDLRTHPEGIRIPAPPFLYGKFGDKGVFGKLMIRLLSRTKFKAYPHIYRKYERIGFMTPSGKVELLSSRLQEIGCDGLPVYREATREVAAEYPLTLTTGAKARCYVHSQGRNIPSLRKLMPENLAEMHPETAAGAGVTDGDRVRVESPRGSVACQAKVTTDIMPRVVQLYHGFAEANANLLTDDAVLDPVTGSAPVRAAVCRIAAAQSV